MPNYGHISSSTYNISIHKVAMRPIYIRITIDYRLAWLVQPHTDHADHTQTARLQLILPYIFTQKVFYSTQMILFKFTNCRVLVFDDYH